MLVINFRVINCIKLTLDHEAIQPTRQHITKEIWNEGARTQKTARTLTGRVEL